MSAKTIVPAAAGDKLRMGCSERLARSAAAVLGVGTLLCMPHEGAAKEPAAQPNTPAMTLPTVRRGVVATSCSQAAVQAAINAARDGDAVTVPAGSATWNTPVTIAGKAITLQGAGMSKTIITAATRHTQSPLAAIGVDGKPFRITGFTFNGARCQSGMVNISGTCKNFRVDHCRISNDASESDNGRGIMTVGYTFGVIDHCVIIKSGGNSVQGVSVMGDGNASWERPITLGSSNAVYVEDCIFNYGSMADGAIDAYSGARYVFRHNTLINTCAGHHGLDSGGYRSPHSFEYYENTFMTDPNTYHGGAFHFRGGTGVVFDNTLTGYSGAILLANYRSANAYPPWGMCDGKNPIDGNQDPSGYPCKDQVGRTTGQKLEPFYEWNNVLNGKHAEIKLNTNVGTNLMTRFRVQLHIKENRDYYNNTVKPGYVPYAYPHPLTLDPAGRQQATATPPSALSLDPHPQLAAQKRQQTMLLTHARFLLAEGEPETAGILLQQLVARDAGTESAAQARELLKAAK